MFKEQLKDPVAMSEAVNTPHYGLGVAITNTAAGQMFWHNGATLGYSSFAGNIPKSGVTIVVFMNMMPTASGDSTAATSLVAPLLTALPGK